MKLAIGNDHAAVELKQAVINHLQALGHEVVNYGTNTHESCNYSVSAEQVALAVVNKEVDGGILICGTGVGISLSANKIKGIRAAVCSEPYTAMLSKQHNNSNIIAFGSRVVGEGVAIMIVDAWLNAEFEGGRHATRVSMIEQLEEKYMK